MTPLPKTHCLRIPCGRYRSGNLSLPHSFGHGCFSAKDGGGFRNQTRKPAYPCGSLTGQRIGLDGLPHTLYNIPSIRLRRCGYGASATISLGLFLSFRSPYALLGVSRAKIRGFGNRRMVMARPSSRLGYGVRRFLMVSVR